MAGAAFNHGDVAWLLAASSMVLFMTVPGLALFYGGLSRRRSVLSTMMYSLIAFAVVSLAWLILGHGIAFGSDVAGFIGNPADYLAWLAHYTPFKPASGIPLPIFIGFELVFAAIATAIVSSAVVERAKIEAWILFSALWSLAVYAVIAHWVWGGGWAQHLKAIGLPEALDFAGGVVVHIASGWSALMLALLLGRRRVEKLEPIPHNVPMVLLGTGILWFGWMGFNAGSALAANPIAASAWLATNTAAAAGGLTWLLLSIKDTGRASAVGFASGAVAGLVAITPCAGYVDPLSAIVVGAVASIISYNMINWRLSKGIDETLDAWAVHGMSGLWGSIAVGIFGDVNGAKGLITGNVAQLASQIITSVAAILYAMAVTAVLYFIVDKLVGWRVPPEAEYVGIDVAEYSEEAYVSE